MFPTVPLLFTFAFATIVLIGAGAYLLMASRRLNRRVRELQAALDEKERQYHQLHDTMLRTQRLGTAGRLTRGIAHDFNNSLTAILGYSEMLLEQMAERQDLCIMLREIVTAGRNARDIVRRLLSFSRQGASEAQPIPLLPMLQDVQKLLRTATPAYIEINVPPPSADCCAMVNPGQLVQAILNLSIYAIDIMRNQKKGALTIELTPQVDPGMLRGRGVAENEYLGITLSNSVQGSSAGNMADLFTPGSPIHEQTEDGGLGLAAALRLITAHRGFLYAENGLDAGITFTILIPHLTARGPSTPN